MKFQCPSLLEIKETLFDIFNVKPTLGQTQKKICSGPAAWSVKKGQLGTFFFLFLFFSPKNGQYFSTKPNQKIMRLPDWPQLHLPAGLETEVVFDWPWDLFCKGRKEEGG